MRRSFLLLTMLLIGAACGTTDTGGETTTTVDTTTTTGASGTTSTTEAAPTTTVEAAFPVTVDADNGTVTIEERPESIVSLSTVATEIVFAIAAGDQVVAVDDQSNYPEDAPMTDLSGFTPNIEAILAYEPDLVFISYDPGDLVASLQAADVPVISFGAAATLDDTYRQIEVTGAATGHIEEAIVVNESIQDDLAKISEEAPDVPEDTTYFHEIDADLYTVTSSTFFGQIYSMFGLENIADPADEDGTAFGYPQISSEFLVAADPDLIFLADSVYGESAETVAARPGWDVLTAVQEGGVFELDSDIASRWGPRIVEFAESISDALDTYMSQN
ncbi:MAG TPA: ABC transporter substrate-binding protein [Acidimicrobiia bacterium]